MSLDATTSLATTTEDKGPLPQGRGLSAKAIPRRLTVSIGRQCDKGAKAINQDFTGARVPDGSALALKGVALAIADGISSSAVSGLAAQSAVASFLADYFCTSDAWSVKTSAERVISAANSWLHAETRRSSGAYDMDRGYVCSFTALVLKAGVGHLFHIGDCRVSRRSGGMGRSLEPLTEDHRVAVSAEQNFLARALGAAPHVEIDYRTVPLQPGDVFLLTTDGVHDHLSGAAIADLLDAHADDLDAAARAIVAAALAAGSPDNLTAQILRVETLPDADADAVLDQSSDLQPPPLPQPRDLLDGYRILRQLYASSRSHVFLALDTDSGTEVALKIPSTDLAADAEHLKRFMMEEWIARRLNSPHVLKAHPQTRPRTSLYVVTEHLDGQTLTQWMRDHPAPDLETVRAIAEQISAGLNAFHRLEMLHQDVRPDNIMIDRAGTVTLIDFGSTRVAGVVEAAPAANRDDILGTAQYTAPEYFLGQSGSPRADLFSLGVVVYQLLTGRLPYGAEVARTRNPAQQAKLVYAPASELNADVPHWMDAALCRAVSPNPLKRQEALSEFVFDLRHPRAGHDARRPLVERNPVLFWKGLSAVLALVIVLLLWRASLSAGLAPAG